ncbi:MAG: hypothetical protein ACYS9X_17605 [Planctomycetota bacterium]
MYRTNTHESTAIPANIAARTPESPSALPAKRPQRGTGFVATRNPVRSRFSCAGTSAASITAANVPKMVAVRRLTEIARRTAPPGVPSEGRKGLRATAVAANTAGAANAFIRTASRRVPPASAKT